MKYVIYARISPRGSDFEGETTIQLQMQFCRDYVKFHGGEVVGEYFDEFISGKNMDRPNFSRIMAELDSGSAQWDAIICYKLSRLTRSLKDGVNIFDDLLKRGKSFVSATENIDLGSPAGRAMFGMMQVFNQFEREQSAENVKNKALSIAQRGEWANGRAPFGYTRSGVRHDNILRVDDANAAIVRDVFNCYISGMGIPTIAAKYRGVLVKSQISVMLRNPTYTGKILHTGKVFLGKQPAIISDEVFAKAQMILPQEKTIARTGAYKHYNFLLSGLLRCNCGSCLTAGTAQSGRYAYYTCTNDRCRRRVSAPKIEEVALQFIRSIKLDEATIAATVEELKQRVAEQRKKFSPNVERLMNSKNELDSEKSKLMAVLLGNDLHTGFVAELNSRMEALQTRMIAIDSELNAIGSMCIDDSSIYEIAADFAKKVRHMQDVLNNASPEAVQAVCREQIKRIELQPDGQTWHIEPFFGKNSADFSAPPPEDTKNPNSIKSSDKEIKWWALQNSNL